MVTFDLPGHGSLMDEPFTTEEALRIIDKQVQTDDPAVPVILGGHSLGGYLASLYAASRPGALAGLVMMGASGDPSSPLAAIYRSFAWMIQRIDHRRTARIRDQVARMLGLSEEQIPDAAAYQSLPAAWQSVIEDCPAYLLNAVTCPVLFINGQFDQMRLNERRYLSLARDSALVIIPRASHIAPMTHPQLVAEAIGGFVAGLTSADCACQHADSR